MELTALGDRIRTIRQHRGLTQQHLASALDVTAQAVSKWERGDNAPDLFLMPSLAAILNTSIDALMGFERRALRSVEGTVLFSSQSGYTARAEGTSPEEIAVYLNSHFYAITECVVQHSGLPIKYMGDAFLAVFTSGDHRQNAVRAARAARSMSPDSLSVGITTGRFYMGPMGHPDFARLDIVGDIVNAAARIQAWAGQNTQSGIAVSVQVLADCPPDISAGDPQEIQLKGKATPVAVREVFLSRV
jgi:class 3 adenylate cyclase